MRKRPELITSVTYKVLMSTFVFLYLLLYFRWFHFKVIDDKQRYNRPYMYPGEHFRLQKFVKFIDFFVRFNTLFWNFLELEEISRK